MYEAILLDVETTGINDGAEVIEFAAVAVSLSEGGLEYERIADERFEPSGKISLGALSTHNITPEELEGCRPSSCVEVPKCEFIVGHNIDFDWRMLGEPNVRRICTLSIARRLWPDIDCHRLAALAYHLYGSRAKEMVKGCHSAFDDVVLNAQILAEMLPLMGVSDWEDVWRYSEASRIPSVMPFGKHKGVPIEEVPDDYKRWLMKQDDVDPYLMKALEGKTEEEWKATKNTGPKWLVQKKFSLEEV